MLVLIPKWPLYVDLIIISIRFLNVSAIIDHMTSVDNGQGDEQPVSLNFICFMYISCGLACQVAIIYPCS